MVKNARILVVSAFCGFLQACPSPPAQPTVEFVGSPTAGFFPLTVQFTSTTNADPLTVSSYLWEFGDGATSTELNPSHAFSDLGAYTVKLTVGANGSFYTKEKPAFVVTYDPKIRRVSLARKAVAEDGATWSSAFSSIQLAIETVETAGGGEVWIAAGDYGSTLNALDGSALKISGSVDLYGGFEGNESEIDERPGEILPTIIDASTAMDGQPAFHVITSTGDLRLDRLVVRGGVADGESTDDAIGGGVYIKEGTFQGSDILVEDNVARSGGGLRVASEAEVELNSCTFRLNEGAAIQVDGGSLTVVECDFEDNSHGVGGALSLSSGSTVSVDRSLFHTNTALVGGAIYTYALANITNCVFWENAALPDGSQTGRGGAIFWEGSRAEVVNCTFYDNAATTGGAIQCVRFPLDQVGSIEVRNSILWGNTPSSIDGNNLEVVLTVSYSLVQGGATGAGNIESDPEFSSPNTGNFLLDASSPAIDSARASDSPSVDYFGMARPQGNGVDMGAIERQ
jgi:PKD repeat protein